MSSKEPDKGSGQMAQFIEAARELGCDDDPERFKETVRKIASSPPASGPSKAQKARQNRIPSRTLTAGEGRYG
jgi:hypothetical protein